MKESNFEKFTIKKSKWQVCMLVSLAKNIDLPYGKILHRGFGIFTV